MPLVLGNTLGPYEIVGAIGTGGMGEVYRARDSRLNRSVAIKVSSEQFTERFQREARAIAALNHSNICHLYNVGPDYLVMELVEGPTLAERIKQGAIPLEDALPNRRGCHVVSRDVAAEARWKKFPQPRYERRNARSSARVWSGVVSWSE
jgi:serine/threonine protein kinase